jgi:hypothetical protein
MAVKPDPALVRCPGCGSAIDSYGEMHDGRNYCPDCGLVEERRSPGMTGGVGAAP